MSETLVIAIISAVTPPIIAVLLGPVASQLGAVGRTKSIEFQLKRAELVRALRDLQKAGFENHDWPILEREVDELLQYLAGTSNISLQHHEDHQRPKSRILQSVILPQPHTVAGWIFTIVYYLYAFTTVLYIGIGIQYFFWPDVSTAFSDAREIVIPTIFSSLFLVVISRWIAIRAYERASKRHLTSASS